MRIRFVLLFAFVLSFMLPALAQDSHSEASLNLAGLFPKEASANGVTDHASSEGGLLVIYRFHFNRWSAAEANYSFTRLNQIYTYSNESSSSSVLAKVHEISLAYVFTFGRPAEAKYRPFAEAGIGGLFFVPISSSSFAGATTQDRFVPIYGGGVDVALSKHLSFRAGYRGVLYSAPDFSIAPQVTNKQTHLAEPYLGLSYRF
jgi:opacity protein-like surface antigen